MIKTQVEEKFINFHEKWMTQLEDLLQLLHLVSKEKPAESVYMAAINKLTAHHKEFYTFKWDTEHDNVLAVFNPVWLSPLENAYLWITDWKPSTVFRLEESLRATGGGSLAGLSEDQVKKLEALRVKMKVEEEKVEREMKRQQVSMADRKMVELARMQRRVLKNVGDGATVVVVDEVDGLVEVAVKGLLGGLEKVMKMADCSRFKTLKVILDVYSYGEC